MHKKILAFLFSNRLMAALFVLFALALAVGTFVENAYNTDTARALIYNASWFEAILGLFVLNFLGNIGKYRLYRKKKWPVLILHLSFILIISGAFITRYFGREGTVSIREGEIVNRMISDEAYLTVFIDSEESGKRKVIEKQLLLSPITPRKNYFLINTTFQEIPVEITYLNFMLNDRPDKEEAKMADDTLILKVKTPNKEKEVILLGKKGKLGTPEIFFSEGLKYTFAYGSKIFTLPFKIQLRDFIAEKYPGTQQSYASFESKVTVMDTDQYFDARIYMNHVLDYKGYRFFQASFHPDEKGTILSVNRDFWGTSLTYIGYFFLYLGMIATLFDKNSRFGKIKRKLARLDVDRPKVITAFLMLFCFTAFGQGKLVNFVDIQHKLEAIVSDNAVDKTHAEKFGRLVIQDDGGRMKPLNTYTSELLRKVSKRDEYNGLNADQVFLSMLQFPKVWYNIPLIYLKRGNANIRTLIDIDLGQKYAPLASFFDDKGRYKIAGQVVEAYRAAVPNQFQKDFIEADKRVNLMLRALGGQIFRIFPIPGDTIQNKWIATTELDTTGITGKDSLFIRNILPHYFESIVEASKTNNYTAPDLILDKIKDYQAKFGSSVMPAETKIRTEILYNKYDIFKRLFAWYLYSGLVMLLVSVLHIFKQNRFLSISLKVFYGLIFFLFLMQTTALATRWYVSGHAPWSDAYESMIYIGWATMLFGLVLGRKSGLTVASTAFVTSMILMVAHWNWLDPAIANLQPVLNSYWLMIHVAIIVASYGPFTLGMVLGLVSLLLMTLLNKQNKLTLEVNLSKILLITEMSLTVGLVMLTIGNFLGGQWANESWGRYWAWDPKETWALISIMVYAFIIHMRLVPGLRGKWLFALMSVLGFYAILMTYFGVNFYLSGLHSYAQGDKVVTPVFVYYSLGGLALLATVAYFKQRRYLN
ncbi:MAG: hypothetical protein DHS20C18_25900 [Saprospiraceae bacterium]|nr:MAG: hypothetical protein DHS20C18_25900 [Saprospiraceae bacterium]